MLTAELSKATGPAARRQGHRFSAGLGRLPADVGEWLRRQAAAQGNAAALLYLKEGAEEWPLSYAELDAQARGIAGWLRAQGKPGDRVLLLHGPGPLFLGAFFGCLYAGMIAVPAYPPRRTRHGDRLAAIAQDCGAELALCDRAGAAALKAVAAESPLWAGLRSLDHEAWAPAAPSNDQAWRPQAGDTAFLQYTSGSTGSPKGVMVSHANLRHNVRLFSRAFALDGDSVMVSWAPLFHDMGLILGVLGPLAQGALPVLLPPNAFLKQPSLWLKALARHRGTHSVAPDFGYRLCSKGIPEDELAGLDLSAWRVAISGAEPIREETLEAFAQRFGAHGFRRQAFRPAYGLAEATLVVSGRVDAKGWHKAPLAGRVTSGRPYAQRVRIVDPVSLQPMPEGQVGEIWIQGPSITQGYWRRREESQAVFGAVLEGEAGAFLRTGDLGCLEGGELVVTGRLKDLIILHGANHYPQDIEATVQACSPDFRTGAAFSLESPEGESVVLVQEVARHPQESLELLAQKAFQALSEGHGIRLADLVLVQAMAVPRTSSGKIQRRACREAYLQGSLHILYRHPAGTALSALEPGAGAMKGWLHKELERLGGAMPLQGWAAPCAAWGLDSLRIAELAALLERHWGLKWPLSAAYEQGLDQLIAGLSLKSHPGVGSPKGGDQGKGKAGGAAMNVAPPASGRPLAVPPALESLWAAQALDRSSTAYHIAWTVQLGSCPDRPRLAAALQQMARSQGALRCSFHTGAEGCLWQTEQAVLPVVEEPWSAPGSLADALQWAQARNLQAFDTAQAPLWRCALLPLEDGGALLVLIFHHLVFDQRSFAVFNQQLDALYRGGAEKAAAGSAAIPDGQPSFEEQERSKSYWKERLRGWAGMPWDGKAPGKEAAQSLHAELSAPVLLGLKRIAAQNHCTLFNVASMLWAEALSGASGQAEACFAIPITLRDLPLSESAIGYWVHPMPLRLAVRPSDSLGARLAAAARGLQEAMAHRGITLSQAAREAACPMPGAFLVYQGALGLPEACLGQVSVFRPLENGAPKAPLALELSGDERWSMKLDHDPALLGVEQAQSILGRFIGAAERLAGMAQARQEPAWGRAGLVSAEPSGLAEVFFRRARRDPKAVALRWADGHWDYATLAEKSGSVAEYLGRLGVQRGDAVGVCCEAGAPWVAAVLACLGLGAIYVPLDPAYPAERLRYMASAAGCKVFLSDRSRPAWSTARPWGSLAEALAHPPLQESLRAVGGPSDCAYIIFTSGSSGSPKGVRVPQSALLNLCQGLARAWRLSPADRVLQFVSMSFDPSLEELLPALLCGASVALARRSGAPSAQALAGWVRELEVSILHLPVAYWHTLVQSGMAKAFAGARQLRALVVGGESPSAQCLKLWAEDLPQLEFFNAYGPTEACVSATLWAWRKGEPIPDPLPLGLPLPGVEAVLCGPEGALASEASQGELWIGGLGLAEGYLDPAQGEGRFIWAAPDGGLTRRFYRSGDMAIRDREGRLVYRGRVDRQLKVSGMRLDLEELEALLRSAPGVGEAAALAQGSGDAVKLEAFVSAKPKEQVDAGVLIEWLKERVPAAWVPAKVQVLSQLPQTPNGKVDYASLRSLGAAVAFQVATEAAVSREESLAGPDLASVSQAFGLALGRTSLAPDQDFFVEGGNSLRAVRLAAELAKLGLGDVPVTLLYEASTPRKFLALKERHAPEGPLRRLSGAQGEPWVLLPPVSGRLEPYQRLAAQLGASAQVWGLDLAQVQAPSEGGWQRWVQACAESIHRSMPAGPLILAGWSMGGLLAAELSARLPALGRAVKRLVVIDALLPDPLTTALVRHESQVLDELIERDLGPGSLGSPVGEQERERYRQHAQALGSFELRPLSVPLSLVVSERTAREEARHGWMAWALMAAKGMTTQLAPGDHFSILQGPGVARISQRLLRECAEEGARCQEALS